MKKLSFFIVTLIVAAMSICSCTSTETYAEKRDRENESIQNFINKNGIRVISESQFINQGYKTNNAINEFVLFETSGVYMQIANEGCGEKLKDGETVSILCRFSEYNLQSDSIVLTNTSKSYAAYYDRMVVTNTSGTFTGSFDAAQSLFYLVYGDYNSTSVPAGWLEPLRYIKLGRPATEDEDVAAVRIIVPSAQGHYYQSTNVYACYYEVTYMRGR